MGFDQFNENHPALGVVQLQDFMATSVETLFANTANPARIDSIVATTNDTIDHVVVLAISPLGFGNYQLGSVVVPAGAGHGGLPGVDILTALPASFAGLVLRPLDELHINLEVALAAGKFLYVVALGGFF